jgi:hypothetical protein
MDATWILLYVFLVLVATAIVAWQLDRRDNARDDAERMRRHLEKRDSYLDPQGWNQ